MKEKELQQLTDQEKTVWIKVQEARKMQHEKNQQSGLDKAKAANIRQVSTSHGEVRVLEYGFDTSSPCPLMIDLHGGGFIFNTADADEQIILQMLQQVPQCRFISIDYPKAPEHPYPAALDAVYEVVNFYVKNAERFGIDTEHMVIGGHSAGANLATVTCMRTIQRKEFFFKGQILDYPPLDLNTPAIEKPLPEGCIPPDLAELFNACYVGKDHASNPEISPVFSEANSLTGLPPALIIVCGRDSLCNEGIRYAGMLENASVSVKLTRFPDELHGFTYDATPEATRAIQEMAAFLAQCIGSVSFSQK